MTRVLLTATLALLAGCSDMLLSDAATPEARGLVLEVAASARELAPGDTVRLVARLTNTTPHTMRLTFGSGCQIMPYIEGADNRVVEPGGGGWICTAAITYLTLAGGEAVEREHRWTGTVRRWDPETGRSVSEALPAGTYQARFHLERALLDGPGGTMIQLRTEAIPIVLR